ncbi:MAG: precorrin-2 dehydrogenase/sirohydrochlorin ferrochelatase family protein [Acidimicrobiales bacterium]
MSAGHRVYPVALLLEAKRCLVVGGGPLAARKAAQLLDSGAEVTLVAPRLDPSVEVLAKDRGLLVERRPYTTGEAGGYRLVITATGTEVDSTVAADSEAAGVWVNAADDTENCTFFLPAVHREGAVTIAVSTGGASPALAVWLRDRVATLLGGGLETAASLLSQARTTLRAAGRRTDSVDWRSLLDGPFSTHVHEGHIAEASAQIAELLDSPPGRPSVSPGERP